MPADDPWKHLATVLAQPAEPGGRSDWSAYNQQYAKPGPYRTPLSDAEEPHYRQWVGHMRDVTGTDLDPDDPSYDMRGFWKAMHRGEVKPPDQPGGHFVDEFKTPAHPFFSRESKYATPTAPYWQSVPPLSGAMDALIDPSSGELTPAFQQEVAQGLPGNEARDALLRQNPPSNRGVPTVESALASANGQGSGPPPDSQPTNNLFDLARMLLGGGR